MVKKILIILICLISTGCFDYKELNQIAIVSGIGVDYEDEYIVSLEVIKGKKSDGGEEEETIIYEGAGKDFISALKEATGKVDKDAYFYQTEILAMSEDVGRRGIEDILDYLLRESKINNDIYPIIVKGCLAKDLFNLKKESESVISTAIVNLIKDGSSIIKYNDKDELDFYIGKYLTKRHDLVFTAVKIIDEKLVINELGVFDGDRFRDFLNEEDSKTYNLIVNDSEGIYLDDGVNFLEILNNKAEIKYETGIVKINFNCEAKITKIDKDLDLKNGDTYDYLSKNFSNILEDKITHLVDVSRRYNSDILGFSDVIYRSKKKDYESDIGLRIKYEVDAKVDVNKNGLLFEVVK